MELVTILLGVVIGLILLQLYKALTSSRQPLPEPAKFHLGDISLRSLGAYNGLDWSKPALVAIKGKVYDVSSSSDKFGPGEFALAAAHTLHQSKLPGSPVWPCILSALLSCPLPGKEFGVYAGREISRALAKDSVDASDLTDDLSGLSDEELARLARQAAVFASTYDVVGQVNQLRRVSQTA